MPESNESLSLSARVAIDELCDAFETRLRDGEEPRIEHALDECPIAYRPHLFRELRKLESEYRRACSDADYRRRFPEYADPTSELTTHYHDSALSRDDALPRIPGYEILSKLGEGGMGVVYQAREVKLDRIVALKMIRGGEFATDVQLKRFAFEAEAAAKLDHPHIAPIYQVGETSGSPFFSLKYLEGGTLADLLSDGVFCDPMQAAALLAPIARAVQHAHERGVLHRDLKPANILLDREGKPHVADFGLARRLDQDIGHTLANELVGTLQFMAPEQARAERVLTIATDVYGLGTIFYALLTGQPPFRGSSRYETLQMVQEQPVQRPRDRNAAVPCDLESICLRCLEKEPANRYASAGALAEDLERFLAGEPIAGQKSSAVALVRRLLNGRKEPTTLVTLSVFWWLAGLVFLGNGALWLLGFANAPVWAAWLLQGLVVAFSLGLSWWYYVQNDSLLSTMERQSMAMSTAHQLAVCLTLAVTGPTDPAAPVTDLYATSFPAITIATGLAWFAHGAIGFGSCYLLGLAFFPLALLLRFWPPYAPLIYGAALSASLLGAGWMMRDMLNRTQARHNQQV